MLIDHVDVEGAQARVVLVGWQCKCRTRYERQSRRCFAPKIAVSDSGIQIDLDGLFATALCLPFRNMPFTVFNLSASRSFPCGMPIIKPVRTDSF